MVGKSKCNMERTRAEVGLTGAAFKENAMDMRDFQIGCMEQNILNHKTRVEVFDEYLGFTCITILVSPLIRWTGVLGEKSDYDIVVNSPHTSEDRLTEMVLRLEMPGPVMLQRKLPIHNSGFLLRSQEVKARSEKNLGWRARVKNKFDCNIGADLVAPSRDNESVSMKAGRESLAGIVGFKFVAFECSTVRGPGVMRKKAIFVFLFESEDERTVMIITHDLKIMRSEKGKLDICVIINHFYRYFDKLCILFSFIINIYFRFDAFSGIKLIFN